MRMSFVRFCFFLFFMILLSTGICLSVFFYSGYSEDLISEDVVLFEKGETPRHFCQQLFKKKIIGYPRLFFFIGKIFFLWKNVKAGEYKLTSAMPPVEIFTIISSGVSLRYPFLIREGENIYEIQKNLKEQGFQAHLQFLDLIFNKKFIQSLEFFSHFLPDNLEGYLFPETYFFPHQFPAEEMILHIIRHFFDEWKALTLKINKAPPLPLSVHQLVTLASLIEKETGCPSERAKISSVFYNRLSQKMKLQSDPTTIYGMWQTYTGKLHHSDLLIKNAYNTYRIEGLPKGPIANPGRESLLAAFMPEKTKYLFFVSRNDGTHEFTTNLKDHNQAVFIFQKFSFPKKKEKREAPHPYQKKTE